MDRYCGKCGAVIPVGNGFCAKCGTMVSMNAEVCIVRNAESGQTGGKSK